eukprot:3608644-Lingulodinium_polyedra.AAC.1
MYDRKQEGARRNGESQVPRNNNDAEIPPIQEGRDHMGDEYHNDCEQMQASSWPTSTASPWEVRVPA